MTTSDQAQFKSVHTNGIIASVVSPSVLVPVVENIVASGELAKSPATKLSGAAALLRALQNEGVTTIFGYPGGAIMPVYDALYDVKDTMRHVLVRHEQAAAHAAEGYARMTGMPGVCMATSGPGATNLVTGIADAMMDSVPIVCITGQVHKRALGTDAFQETDVIGITIPITKWNFQVTEAHEIPVVIAKAFAIANSGRPGPVLVDITKNAQMESFVWTEEVDAEISRVRERFFVAKSLPEVARADLLRAAEVINAAKRPLMFVGHGVLISKASKVVRDFAEKTDIPVASTLQGLSAFPTGHPNYVGMLGMHGNYGPNILTNRADVIVAVGMRFDDRVTGDIKSYAPGARIVHVEIDPAEIGKVVQTEVGLVGDARDVLERLLPLVEARKHTAWFDQFKVCAEQEHQKVIAEAVAPGTGPLKMSEVIHELSRVSEGQGVIVADVGQHQMMAARYYAFSHIDSWVSSGGLGTMGFALPAAMGVQLGAEKQYPGFKRPVLTVIGDGGFQMNSQELMTIAQENMPIKVIILNNNYLGMVRQWQELFFDNRYSSVNMENPDFVKLADAYGIKAARVTERDGLEEAIKLMLDTPGAFVLEVCVETEQNVFPMVAAGASVSDIRLE